MHSEHTPGMVGRLRQSPGNWQRTFRTPLERLPAFVAALLLGAPRTTGAVATIRAIVVEPKNLARLLAHHGLAPALDSDWSITATNPQDVNGLIEAALGDWVDFWLVPHPKGFTLYADHDEYATVFAARRGPLSKIGAAMEQAGVVEVKDWVRTL